MNIEIGDSVKIVNAIDPIKMVVIDKIDNEHLTTSVLESYPRHIFNGRRYKCFRKNHLIQAHCFFIIKHRNTQKTYLDNNIEESVSLYF